MRIPISETVWGWVSVAAIAIVVVAGLPFLGRGGGRLGGGGRRRGGRGRGGYRVRVGPSTPMMAASVLVRHLDTVLLVAATAAVIILIVMNATA